MRQGNIVTISRNKVTGDRSYTHGLYQVVGINALHVSVKPLTNRLPWWAKTHFLTIDEHDFSNANLDMLPKNERARALVHLNYEHMGL